MSDRTSHSLASAVLLLIVASIPIALLAKPLLAIVLIVTAAAVLPLWFSPANNPRVLPGTDAGAVQDSTPKVTAGLSGPFWATCLFVGSVAVASLAAQLLCAAIRSNDAGSCATFCGVVFARTARMCNSAPDRRADAADVAEINAAAIANIYEPEVSPSHVHGLVLLDARTTDGAHYMRNSGVLLELLRSVVPGSAEDLAQAFRKANDREGTVERVQRFFPEQLLLDSLDVERYLATAAGPGKILPIDTAPIPNLPQPVPLTGVLALSKPGIDSTGSTAVMFAVLRTPQSVAPDKFERASIMLLRRTATYWQVSKAWPIQQARNAR